MPDDLINLIILGVIFLLSAVFSGKKKKGVQTGRGMSEVRQAPRPRPNLQDRAASRPPRPVQHPAPGTQRPARPPRQPASSPQSMMQDILDLLEEKNAQVEKPTLDEHVFQEPRALPVEDFSSPEAQSRPIVVREERPLVSSEALEVSGKERHEDFHDKYVRPLEAPPVSIPARFQLSLDSTSIRRAVIWSEILGEPKGMR